MVALASMLVPGCLVSGCMFPDGSGHGPSEYQVSFGSVLFKSSREGSARKLPGADAGTFVVISRGDFFGKDAQHVYFEDRLIEGADPATFRRLAASYSADGTSVFYKAQKLIDANPATMDLSGSPSVTDGTRFYYNGDLLVGAVARVIELGSSGYLSDRHGAIFRKGPVRDSFGDWTDRVFKVDACDPPSFEARKHGRALDRDCAYAGAVRLPVRDRASFQFLEGYWWKDRTGVFRGTDLMVGVDPATAETVFSKSSNYDPPLLKPPGDYFLRDKAGCRRLPREKPAPCPADAVPAPVD